MKIIDYTVVERHTPADMDLAILEGIREGWQPLGGVSMAMVELRGYSDVRHRYVYCQAMVQYEEAAHE